MFWRMSPTLWFSAECSRMSWKNSVVGSFVEGPIVCVWEGKPHRQPWVQETTTTSGVAMIVSLHAMGCKEDGSSHFSCHEHPPTSERKQGGRNLLISLFSVSVFEWKTKEHYLKEKPCLFCILIVLGKDTQSVSKVVWFIQSPNHCLHKESTLFSVGFSLIDIHWFHRGLSRSQDFR